MLINTLINTNQYLYFKLVVIYSFPYKSCYGTETGSGRLRFRTLPHLRRIHFIKIILTGIRYKMVNKCTLKIIVACFLHFLCSKGLQVKVTQRSLNKNGWKRVTLRAYFMMCLALLGIISSEWWSVHDYVIIQ